MSLTPIAHGVLVCMFQLVKPMQDFLTRIWHCEIFRTTIGPFLIAAAIIVAIVCLIGNANATWKPEYASQPQEVQDWYRNAELTKPAQERLHIVKCCDKADVVKTKFKVSKTSGDDEWQYLDGDTWKVIPPDIIHFGVSAPGGQPTLFVWSGKPTCFFPGAGGI